MPDVMPTVGRRGMMSRKPSEAYDAKQTVRKCNSIIRSIEVGLKKLENDIIASLGAGSGSDSKFKPTKSRAKSPSDLEWQPVPRPTHGPRVKYSSRQTLQQLQQRRRRQGALKRSKSPTTNDNIDPTETATDSSLSAQLQYNPLADRQQLFKVTPRVYWSSQEKIIEIFIDTLCFPGRMLVSLPDSRKPSQLECSCLRAYATGFDLDADWDDPEWGSVQYYSGLLELIPGGERFLPHVACHHGVRLFARAIESQWFPDYLASHLVSVALGMKSWLEAEYLLRSLLVAAPQKLPRSINPNNIVPFPLDTSISHPEILIRAVDKLLFDRPDCILEPWFLRFWKYVAGQPIGCSGIESLTISVLQLAMALPTKTNANDIQNSFDSLMLFKHSDAASLAHGMVAFMMRDILRALMISEGSNYGNFGGIAKAMIARLIEKPRAPSMENTNRLTKILLIIPMLFLSPLPVDIPTQFLQREAMQCLLDGARSSLNKNECSLQDDEEEEEPNLNDMASSVAVVLFSLPNKQGYSEKLQQKIRNNIRSWLWRLGTFLFRYVWQEAESRDGAENSFVSPSNTRVASMSTSMRKFTIISKFISSIFGQLASLDNNGSNKNNNNKYPWSDYEKSIESLLTSIPMDHSCLDKTGPGNQKGDIKYHSWSYEDMVGTWVARSPEQKKCATKFSVVVKRSASRLSSTTLRCHNQTLPGAHQHCRSLRKRNSCPMPINIGQPEQLHLPRGKRPRRSINYAVSSSSEGDSASDTDKSEKPKFSLPTKKSTCTRRQFMDAVVIERRIPTNTTAQD